VETLLIVAGVADSRHKAEKGGPPQRTALYSVSAVSSYILP
jgi:hypothetical protein